MEDYLEFFEEDDNYKKSFNTTGICIKEKHYMVNINKKLKEIVRLVQQDKYFIINRPRQYGKTTTLNELEKILKSRYKVIKLDFQAMALDFENEKRFCEAMSENIFKAINKDIEIAFNISKLIKIIEEITANEEVVLIIDEVDKISNNELFLDFLAVLRALYLSRESGAKTTFKSVILAGVHDVKNLKLKFRSGNESKYNSPWNIAVDFKVDMSFKQNEIETMLIDYDLDNNLNLEVEKLGKEIFKFTNGYPFLVSKVCQIIDEKLLVSRTVPWKTTDVERAVKIIINEKNTLFDDLIKNLENNKNLYEFIYNVLVLNIKQMFNINNPVIELGYNLGYLDSDEDNNIIVKNPIIREVIYNYMISKTNTLAMNAYNFKDKFLSEDNGLNMKMVLLKFQQFMKENYSEKDKSFLERQGVLIFLAFIKPIINGVGFDYKEVQISQERRLDIVISYNNHKYVIETKIWYGEKAHEKGLKQLKNYLDIENLTEGYLLIFDFNKGKSYSINEYKIDDKIIFEARV